jgi:hypothetical protein
MRRPKPLVTLLLAASAIAFGLALFATLKRIETTFDVSAETETLRIRSSTMSWSLDRVALSEGYGGRAGTVSGTLDIAPETEIVFERSGLGPLNVVCTRSAGIVGTFRAADGGQARPIDARAVLVFADPGRRAKEGRPILLPIVGEVELGREVGAGNGGPILRTARVIPLGHRLFRDELYRGTEAQLGAGDRLQIIGADGPAFGLVKADERPALTASYRVLGYRGFVSRYGGEGFTISLSWLERVLNDGAVTGFWLVFFAALSAPLWVRKLWKEER